MTSAEDDIDLDRYFSQSEKQLEIERVLSCFKLDPFSVLELPYTKPDAKSIKMAYRKKSLMIHPDKVKHERAEEAFAMLKKAESELNDEQRLKYLLGIVEEAKFEALRANGYKVKTQPPPAEKEGEKNASSDANSSIDADSNAFLKTSEGQEAVRKQLKNILIEMELRRRRLLKKELEAEGAEARKAEEVVQQRKRKAEEAKKWEETREERVASWRDFQKKGGKKVKKIKRSGL